MVAYHDLYGCRLKDLESARTRVERVLQIGLEAHYSDYEGGDYYGLGLGDDESFTLKRNFDSVEGEWFEEEFKEYPVLLYVENTRRPEDIENRLASSDSEFALLRRQTT
jgi:hypothetical protein